MALKIYQKLLDDLKELEFDGRFTYHHYNEPLLNKNLESLIAMAVHALPRARHVIYTSGDHLTESRLKSLRSAGIAGFVVTDHGSRALPISIPDDGIFLPLMPFHRIRLRRFGTHSALFNRGGLVEVANARTLTSCYYPAYELVVDVSGNVILCCNDYYGKHSFGNIMNEPVMHIWNSERMSSLRARLRLGYFDLPICAACAGITRSSQSAQPIHLSSQGGRRHD